jgi:signal transduction histidine kinase/CheY-like chemotaxis protein
MPPNADPSAQRERQVRADLVAGIYWHIPRSSAGVLAGAGTVVWGMWGQVAHAILFAWLGTICAILLWRFELFRRYRACHDKIARVEHWERLWTLSTGLHGTAWGSSAIVMYIGDSPEYQALLLIAMFAICTAAVPLVGRHRPSLYAFVLPTLVPITTRLAFDGSAAQILLAIFSILVMYGIFLFGNELNRTITESVHRRYENLDLIEQLTLQTARAEAARTEADGANLMKSRFLAAASHDLRQPLHALGLFTTSLRRREVDAGTAEVVSQVCESVEALEQMFDSLLDVSRLEAGGTQAQVQAFALQSLFDRVARDCQHEASAKSLKLRFVPTEAVVTSDAVLVERILRNLVVNAVRYTRTGGVVVGCRHRGTKVGVEVWDTGPGIPHESRERIFEEFYQVASSDGAGRHGLGLGLATVRRLSTQLGVQVVLRSRLGRGSVFGLELERSLTKAPLASTPARRFEDAGQLAQTIIVVIDDDTSALEAMSDVLRDWNAIPVAVESLDAALAGLAECGRYPDAIVSDYRLGAGKNGVDAIARLRDELGLPVPALVVTGDTAAQSLRELEASGHPWLAKPVAADRLHAALVRLLRPEGCSVSPESPATSPPAQ